MPWRDENDRNRIENLGNRKEENIERKELGGAGVDIGLILGTRRVFALLTAVLNKVSRITKWDEANPIPTSMSTTYLDAAYIYFSSPGPIKM